VARPAREARSQRFHRVTTKQVAEALRAQDLPQDWDQKGAD